MLPPLAVEDPVASIDPKKVDSEAGLVWKVGLALNPWLIMIPMKFEIWLEEHPIFKDPQMKTAFFSRFIKMVESCMDVNLGPGMVINTGFPRFLGGFMIWIYWSVPRPHWINLNFSGGKLDGAIITLQDMSEIRNLAGAMDVGLSLSSRERCLWEI